MDDYVHVEGCRNDPDGSYVKAEKLKSALQEALTLILKHHAINAAPSLLEWGKPCPHCSANWALINEIYALLGKDLL